MGNLIKGGVCMETVLGYIALIATVILTIGIYIKWTDSETVVTFSEDARNNYRIKKATFSLLIASVIVGALYWIISKIISITVIVITWLCIFAIVSGIIIFIIGLFTKNDRDEYECVE